MMKNSKKSAIVGMIGGAAKMSTGAAKMTMGKSMKMKKRC